jgi:hypothetical protein
VFWLSNACVGELLAASSWQRQPGLAAEEVNSGSSCSRTQPRISCKQHTCIAPAAVRLSSCLPPVLVFLLLPAWLLPADDRGPGPAAADRDRSGGGGRDARMIGYAAASQSAQQVTAMLGGPPASDRRVQDQLNELLASKSRPELWEVLRLLKEFLGGDRQAASQYFAERPGLTKAVFQAQVLLGESGGRAGSARGTDIKPSISIQSLVGCASGGFTQGSCRCCITVLMDKRCASGCCSIALARTWLWPLEVLSYDPRFSLTHWLLLGHCLHLA